MANDLIFSDLSDGGEGEIRTPDSLTTMPDFESGAFNRALPPLRGFGSRLTDVLAPGGPAIQMGEATTSEGAHSTLDRPPGSLTITDRIRMCILILPGLAVWWQSCWSCEEF